ncbi:hypothetical protein [Kitasatospora purpeofusca]|uniref:hypothetical protein n=1 Tax=Kitasatospora purpeofusca TaxID=67352 RepID=UPI002A599391|nr:hypothetical protein [Kitasatospora purpeofusca]MDY0811425.1 hypothetical protein [Kitasatospora purpeofusca]
MPDSTPAAQPDDPHPALRRLSDFLWASPPELRPLLSPAGPRRRAADRLGHADLDTTTATYTATPEETE